jgi:raffinose/stachyose/melibiose transport system substrate-binding protein
MTIKRFRYLPSFLILGAVLATLLGSNSAGAHRANAPVNITFYYRGTNAQHDQWVKWLVDNFNKQNQGKIQVSVSSTPDADYHQKINLVLSGSNPPDVFFAWEGGYAKSMVDAGYAAPLDAYYKQYNWGKELTPVAAKLATIEGHQYFLAGYISASVVWYNTAIFAKYNLHPPKTWDQLQAIANTLKSHGIAPFLLANQQQWEAQFDWTGYFVNKYGVSVYNQLLNRQIAWTDPRVVATFAQLKSMEDNGWFLSGVNSMDFDGTAIIFWKKQKAAMWYQGSFILPKFLTGKTLNQPVDWFPYPQIGSQKPTVSVFAEDTYMIDKKSAHKAEAAKFLDALVSAQSQQQQVSLVGPYSPNTSAPPVGEPPMVERLGKLIAGYQSSTFMHVDHALGQAVAQPFLEQLQGVLAGTTTPAKAAAVTEAAAVKAMGAGHM